MIEYISIKYSNRNSFLIKNTNCFHHSNVRVSVLFIQYVQL